MAEQGRRCGRRQAGGESEEKATRALGRQRYDFSLMAKFNTWRKG
jgi:hypothetical protein